MKIIPAIDLMNGKCVRLIKGERQDLLSYQKDPIELAQAYVQNGAEMLHVIDLDGAFSGSPKNLDVIAKLAKRFKIQVGGGIRSEQAIKQLLGLGVNRVIVSTLLIENPELAEKIKAKYYGKLIGSFDFKQGMLSYAGWTKQTTKSFEGLADSLETIVVTDTACDGTFKGPNLDLLNAIKQKTNAKILAAGGVNDALDLLELRKLGIYGAIVGRALLEKRVSLRDIFKLQFFGD